MKFSAVKGMRDVYPEDARLRNYILDAWRRVSLRNGFEEYDAPILEYLELFTVKSGPEIAEQLFGLTDRGGRNLAIRPEITPSLARMVAAKINALPRPIKWFSLPRLCRAERPQRGRLREFFQWNVDVIGVESVQADAECIFTLVDFLREVGLSPAEIMVRVGSRPIVLSLLRREGVCEEAMDKALLALDKRQKIPAEAFEAMLREIGVSAGAIAGLCEFLDTPPERIVQRIADSGLPGAEKEIADLQELESALAAMGVKEYIAFDLHIVRGLAYYTGVVYEAIAAGERAVAGGGRYDRLLELVGGPECPATGFGMGDVVLGLLLAEKGKLPPELTAGSLEFYVIDAEEGTFRQVLDITARLRAAGRSADYGFKRQGMGKQLKEADRRGSKFAVLVRREGLSVKTLATGEQTETTAETFLEKIR
ncbi:MAG: histidine--tRNA ligase [Phycisphaerae bacterium]|nr:histidine--tRNA ligase [Phycisphaerae bacterium]